MRRGITPVVAIALLLGMTVAAAGGSYSYLTSTIESGQERTGATLNTEVVVRDLQCRGSTVTAYLKNRGSTGLETTQLDTYLYAGDTLLDDAAVNVSGAAFLQPSGLGRIDVVYEAALTNGEQHTVRFDFGRDDHTVEGACEARSRLIGYWRFDEGSGTWANDTSVFGNDGQLVGDAGWTAGQVTGATVLDGDGDYITVAAPNEYGFFDAFTGTAWVYPRNTSERTTIFRKSADGRNYQLELKADSRIGWTAQYQDCDGWISRTSSLTVTEDAWNFVAITHDADSGTTFVVNDSSEFIGNAKRMCGNGTGSFLVGRGSGFGMQDYDGRVDDLRIYDTALPTDRIELLYNATR